MWSTAFGVRVALASLECFVRLTLSMMAVHAHRREWTVVEMHVVCVCVCMCVGIQEPQFEGIHLTSTVTISFLS